MTGIPEQYDAVPVDESELYALDAALDALARRTLPSTSRVADLSATTLDVTYDPRREFLAHDPALHAYREFLAHDPVLDALGRFAHTVDERTETLLPLVTVPHRAPVPLRAPASPRSAPEESLRVKLRRRLLLVAVAGGFTMAATGTAAAFSGNASAPLHPLYKLLFSPAQSAADKAQDLLDAARRDLDHAAIGDARAKLTDARALIPTVTNTSERAKLTGDADALSRRADLLAASSPVTAPSTPHAKPSAGSGTTGDGSSAEGGDHRDKGKGHETDAPKHDPSSGASIGGGDSGHRGKPSGGVTSGGSMPGGTSAANSTAPSGSGQNGSWPTSGGTENPVDPIHR